MLFLRGKSEKLSDNTIEGIKALIFMFEGILAMKSAVETCEPKNMVGPSQ